MNCIIFTDLARVMSGDRVERRLAAVLAADIASYSRLMEADEELTLARLRAHRRELIDPKVREHHGRIVKTTGDGALIEFASVVDAVRCATEIQRAMLDREAEIVEDRRIRFRIGVNVGDIIIEEGDIFGDGVNVAARLEALAAPGGICISQNAHDQVRGRLPFAFGDLGEQSFKNIARPVAVYGLAPEAVAALPSVSVADRIEPATQPAPRRASRALAAIAAACGIVIASMAAVGWWALFDRTAPVRTAATATPVRAVPPLSIVVLPFENLSADPAQEYFADGVTDDLTSDLSRIAGSFVISRTTAFTYKRKAVDVRRIGRDLGVRYVLEGSVRRSGNQVHVNVQLIDGASEAHVWADQFDTDRANLAQAQDEITGRLANVLNAELIKAAARRIDQSGAANADAQDLVMRGWAAFYRGFSRANEQESRQSFERALALDPQAIAAKIGIANILISYTRFLQKDQDAIEQNEERAEQLLSDALERDPSNGPAHKIMGILRRLQHRLDESVIELKTAIALDPNDAGAMLQLGQDLMWQGQPADGIPWLERSLRLNPHGPPAVYAYHALGDCYLVSGRVDEAIDAFRKAVAANPRLWFNHMGLAAALGLKADIAGAKVEIAASLKLRPDLNSLARINALNHFAGPQYIALADKTGRVGLLRAGFPEK